MSAILNVLLGSSPAIRLQTTLQLGVYNPFGGIFYYGYNSVLSGSPSGVLGANTFVFGGNTYTITNIYDAQIGAGNYQSYITIVGAPDPGVALLSAIQWGSTRLAYGVSSSYDSGTSTRTWFFSTTASPNFGMYGVAGGTSNTLTLWG
jgi:hypothetical protein